MSAQQWERDGHSVIRLGDETAVVVPLAEYRRLKALEEIATPEEIDEAEDAAIMAESFRKGETIRATSFLEKIRKKRADEATTAVPIDKTDLERARAIADKKGSTYEAVIQQAVHEWLDHEEHRIAP